MAANRTGRRAPRRWRDPWLPRDGYRNPLLRTPRERPAAMSVRTEDGARLNVLRYGPAGAPALVLSHGWACRAEFWTPQLNGLAADHRVIVYDQRGHGTSERGSLEFSPQVLADDLAAVLTATLGADERAVLAGHSMGGISIMALAARHPDLLARHARAALLASTGANQLVDASTLVRLPRRLGPVRSTVGRAMMRSRMRLPGSRVADSVVRYVGLSPTAGREEIEFSRRIVASCSPRVRGDWGGVLGTLDVEAGLRNLTVPTTVLVGELDRMIPPRQSERLAEVLAELGSLGEYVVLPGVGHMATVQAAPVVNELLDKLSRLEAPS